MLTKAFSFIHDGYNVKALVHLYPDGKIQDIEILQIWYKGHNLLRTLPDEEQPAYIRVWLKKKYKELRQVGMQRLHHMHLNAAEFYETISIQ